MYAQQCQLRQPELIFCSYNSGTQSFFIIGLKYFEEFIFSFKKFIKADSNPEPLAPNAGILPPANTAHTTIAIVLSI